LAASGFEASALASAFTVSTFSASIFGASDAAGSSIEGSDTEGSGITGSDTEASIAALASDAETFTGSLDVSAGWETPALREPVSPLMGSAGWSLMVKSP
jgi:hypothetical protein